MCQAQQHKATGAPQMQIAWLLQRPVAWLPQSCHPAAAAAVAVVSAAGVPAPSGYHLCRRASLLRSCCCCADCCCRCCMDGSILRRATSKSAMHTARWERCSTVSQPQKTITAKQTAQAKALSVVWMTTLLRQSLMTGVAGKHLT